MTAGLRITNTSGNVQIDETYRNLHLRTKTTCAAGTTTRQVGTALDSPIFAVWSSFLVSVASAFRKEFAAPTTWHLEKTIPSGQSLVVYAFDIGAPLAGDSFGLRVKDAAGNVVFHSSGKPLVVAALVNHAKNTASDYTYTSGRTYAVIPLAPHSGYSFKSITNGVRIEANNAATTAANVGFLVVDVTPL